MSVRVLAPGLLTTLQDGGRSGFRHLGVGAAGALDAHSHAIANLLVGNPATAPVLEITLAGPRLHFDRPARIALCGAEIDARIGAQALPGWRRIDVPSGSELALGACRRGARAYLAVAGGFAAPHILGSASTDLRAGFGGVRGRMLAAGDVLPVARSALPAAGSVAIAAWWIDPAPDLDLGATQVVRVLPGHDVVAGERALFAEAWRVDAASDRQGLRLQGSALALADARERISEPVAPGTIQLPADGRPIVLLADAQTHGGYPRIGHVIAADRPRLAQLRAGDGLRFEPCTPADARRLAIEQRQRLARIAVAIAARG
jgi:antagonist of KipI